MTDEADIDAWKKGDDITIRLVHAIAAAAKAEPSLNAWYNAQAGELAEPVRFLVVADFPTAFEAEALRRLASIATSGGDTVSETRKGTSSSVSRSKTRSSGR